MSWKRKLGGGLLVFIGFMLSPLTWWNDLFVNVPLALLFAWLVSVFYRPAFAVSLVLGYWLTNVLGLVLLHQGAQQFLVERKAYSRKELLKDVAIALAYTALVAALVWLGVLKPIQGYFTARG